MDYPETNDSKNDKPFYSILFQIEWELLVFLESWFGDSEPRLGSLIVLTGTSLYAQAATCADYLRRTWPHSGSFFLHALEEVLKSSAVTSSQGKTRHATGEI
ncbi:hypothetical protein VTN00DRAFT_3122 [Thermoascus crustaceus]|uniref:uncharacterized protein n=1 Tax=Thermoascus crustaceus TaxID=5088 RepID=UPI0037429263